jgi:hypothetical protein
MEYSQKILLKKTIFKAAISKFEILKSPQEKLLCLDQAFFTVFNGGPAGLTDFDLYLTGFLFVENLHVFPFADRAGSPAVGNQFPQSFTPVRF